MFNDLREYIRQVKELGECRIIEGADWNVEIGKICELSISVADPPLLLFDRIKGYPAGYRIATNWLNSYRRISLALGLPDNLNGLALVQAWRDKIRDGMKLIPPVEVNTGPVKENIHLGKEVDLWEFPTPQWHERDGGRYIGTADVVIMKDPDNGWVNLGTYRAQIQDKSTLSLNILPGRHGAYIAKKYWDKGMPCPVALVCGCDPVLYFASASSIPRQIGEYDYAGGIRNKPIEVVRGATVDLPIPATAEIVLEGEFLSPDIENRIEGPFGEWEGYYGSPAMPKPVVKVSAVLHRNEPILGGAPPLMGNSDNSLYSTITLASELWDQLDKEIPGVRGVWYAFRRNLMIIISLNQQYTGHAKQALSIAAGTYRGGPAAMNTRFIIVVDDDIDPSNINEVLWALSTRCDPKTSIDIMGDRWTTRGDPMISPEDRARGNLICSTALIQACKPYYWIKDFPPAIKSSQEVLEKVRGRWGKALFG